MSEEMIDRDEALNALHTQLAYPTEACAIVRSIAAYNPNERLREASINAKLALANWQKYNDEPGDEVVYQAEKLASSINELLEALSPLPQGDA